MGRTSGGWELLAVREGKRGTALLPARPALTPRNRLFGQATPGPRPSLELRTLPGPSECLRKSENLLAHKQGPFRRPTHIVDAVGGAPGPQIRLEP